MYSIVFNNIIHIRDFPPPTPGPPIKRVGSQKQQKNPKNPIFHKTRMKYHGKWPKSQKTQKTPQNGQKPKKRQKVSFGVSKGRPNNVLFCLPPPT